MKSTLFALVSIVMFFSLLMISRVHAEEIILSAGSGPLDAVINPVKSAFEKETGIKLSILFGSASLAFKQLYKWVSETAAVGISYPEMLEILKSENFAVENPGSFQDVLIGRGTIHTIVNKDNPVSKLSKDQLKGIFTGKINNWKEVGGKDSPVIVVLSTLNPATIATFRKVILDGEPYHKELLELGHMDELRVAVETNPEAIVFGSYAVLGEGVKRLETPEVFRPVTLITKGEPPPKIRKLIDFILNGPGKSLVKN